MNFRLRSFACLGFAFAALLSACSTSTVDSSSAASGPDFFLGEWQRNEDLGQGAVAHRSWTFRADGTLEESGYPAWHATAKFKVVARDARTATLRLTEKAGEQADALPESLALAHDPAQGTLMVNGAGPFKRARAAAR